MHYSGINHFLLSSKLPLLCPASNGTSDQPPRHVWAPGDRNGHLGHECSSPGTGVSLSHRPRAGVNAKPSMDETQSKASGLNFQLSLLAPALVNSDPRGGKTVMAQVIGLLSPEWETWIEFLPAGGGILRSESADASEGECTASRSLIAFQIK